MGARTVGGARGEAVDGEPETQGGKALLKTKGQHPVPQTGDEGAMARSSDNGAVPSLFQPRPEDYDYDLDRALLAVGTLRARVPEDAFTASMLGT